MNDSPRRKARELVLKGLYALEAGAATQQEILDDVVSSAKIGSKAEEFSRALFGRVCEKRSWADSHISKLAKNWSLDRIARIDRDILRMAMVELEDFPDIPAKVVLNEAIELAKKYSSANSSRFINGILDQFVKNSNALQPDPPVDN